MKYHGENETVLIQHGYLTWNYWLHAVRQVDVARFGTLKNSREIGDEGSVAESDQENPAHEAVKGETGGVKAVKDLPSRITINVSGLEWFVYNRTPAYNDILTHAKPEDEARAAKEDELFSTSSGSDENSRSEKNGNLHRRKRSTDRVDRSGQHSEMAEKDEKQDSVLSTLDAQSTPTTPISDPQEVVEKIVKPVPFILKILPIWIECHKGAIILGNEQTRALLTTTFSLAQGHIDAGSCESEYDTYRQIFDFDIQNPILQMRPNPDFSKSQEARAEDLLYNTDPMPIRKRWWHVDWHFSRRRRRAFHGLKNLVPHFRRSVTSFHTQGEVDTSSYHRTSWQDGITGQTQWLGLGRYLEDDDRDDHEEWNGVEYARYSHVLDCPSVHMTFYWDVPGKVQLVGPIERDPRHADINGTEAPAYGLDLIIRGGMIDYGPWTDRLRAEIQNAFFPNPYTDAKVARPLSVGAWRQSTEMKIRIELEEEVVMRIPTRESSKDWQWKGRAEALRASAKLKKSRNRNVFKHKKNDKNAMSPETRPFGWISVHVAANSSVLYKMDMVAGTTGYRNSLSLDLRSTRATSSVNHAELWRSGAVALQCDLSNPFSWNALHSWTFGIACKDMELFILRDHMFLLTDLISDFTVGPGAEFMAFVPFQYNINVEFSNLRVYLNVNDANIIDNPGDMEENAFLILGLSVLEGDVHIPLYNYAPTKNALTFSGKGGDSTLQLTLPLWNTLRTFVNKKPIASLKGLSLKGTYEYYGTSGADLTDTLFLDISGMGTKVFLHGFLIRYFMNMKENYFGDNIHFKTLEEFSEAVSGGQDVKEDTPNTHVSKGNDLDTILSIRADKSCALLPANLYSRKENLRVDVLLVEADMRFTNYYMDLTVRSSPLGVLLESFTSDENPYGGNISETQLFIDGVNVYGHRLFGAPPSEPTYVCNWDFDVGRVQGECSSTFLRTLIQAISSFVFTLDDEENALTVAPGAAIYDVTFLKAHVESIEIWFLAGDGALLFSSDIIDVAFNDWAGKRFSERMHADIPKIVLAAIDRKCATRRREGRNRGVRTSAYFRTAIDFKMIQRKAAFSENCRLQQDHIKFHDTRTRRAEWLLHKEDCGHRHSQQQVTAVPPPTMPIPIMPEPLSCGVLGIIDQNDETVAASSSQASQRSKSSRQSSFLSLESRPGSVAPPAERLKRRSDSRSPAKPAKIKAVDRAKTNVFLSTDNALSSSSTSMRSSSPQPGSRLTFASPWSSPYFPLQHIMPDEAELPTFPSGEYSRKGDKLLRAQSHDQEYDDGLDELAHLSFMIDVRPGLVGFCTPVFFHHLSALVGEVKPRHPVDLIDQLQIDIMTKVLRLMKLKIKAREIIEVGVQLPFTDIRLVNAPWTSQDYLQETQRDEYTATAADVHMTLRLDTNAQSNAEDLSDAKTQIIAHCLARDITAAVSEKPARRTVDQAASKTSLKDVHFWLVSAVKTSTRLQVRSVEIMTWSRQLELLAALIHRTAIMAESIMAGFKDIDQPQALQHLAYHLTKEGSGIADPVFLTRPSYVLRSAGDHLRLNDSWKIIARLRYIYLALPDITKHKLAQAARQGHTDCPSDARAHVMTSFEQWRNWDLAEVDNSPVMERIWSIAVPIQQSNPELRNLSAELLIGDTRVVLDPGPHENDILLGDLDVGLCMAAQDPNDATDSSVNGLLVQDISVQTYCAEFAVNLNWQIVELMKDVLQQFQPNKDTKQPPDPHARRSMSVQEQITNIHIAFGSDRGSIKLDSPNLSLVLAAENLNTSVIVQRLVPPEEILTVLVSTHGATMKIKNENTTMLAWRLYAPSVYVSKKQSRVHGTRAELLSAVATCQKLRFRLKRDLLSLLRVVHNIIRDEITMVQRLLPSSEWQGTRIPLVDAHQGKKETLVSVIMFLNDFDLSFMVIPGLTYIISGEVARTSVRPKGSAKKWAIDFDLKKHLHALRTETNRGQEELSLLGMPPINGRILIENKKDSLVADLDTTFEKIELDAGSLRSLVDAINQPRIAKLIVDVKASAQRAGEEFERVIMYTPALELKREPTNTTLPVLFAAHVTFAGLGIQARAHGLKDQSYDAIFDLDLGHMSLYVHNKSGHGQPLFEKPQFRVTVQGITAMVRKDERGCVTNYGRLAVSLNATGVTDTDEKGNQVQAYRASSRCFTVDLAAETASLIVDIAAHLQERIKSITIPEEVKQFRPMRRLTLAGVSRQEHHILQISLYQSLIEGLGGLGASSVGANGRLDIFQTSILTLYRLICIIDCRLKLSFNVPFCPAFLMTAWQSKRS